METSRGSYTNILDNSPLNDKCYCLDKAEMIMHQGHMTIHSLAHPLPTNPFGNFFLYIIIETMIRQTNNSGLLNTELNIINKQKRLVLNTKGYTTLGHTIAIAKLFLHYFLKSAFYLSECQASVRTVSENLFPYHLHSGTLSQFPREGRTGGTNCDFILYRASKQPRVIVATFALCKIICRAGPPEDTPPRLLPPPPTPPPHSSHCIK